MYRGSLPYATFESGKKLGVKVQQNFWNLFWIFATFAEPLQLLQNFCNFCRTFATFAELLKLLQNSCKTFAELLQIFCWTFATFAELLQLLQNIWNFRNSENFGKFRNFRNLSKIIGKCENYVNKTKIWETLREKKGD